MKVLGGLVSPLMRLTWLCDWFLMNLRRFWAVLMLNETERTAWEERERRERAVWGRSVAQMIVPVGVKFDLRGVMFGLKGFFVGRKVFLERGGVELMSVMKAILSVTGVVTELVIGVGTELVTGVGVETPCIIFSLFLDPSSFLNWLRSSSPGCSSGKWCFFFFLLCLAGDNSVNAGGLDVTAVVASFVVAVVVVTVVVTVIVFERGVLPFKDYLGPPFFFVGMVSRLLIWLAWWGCQGCCSCWWSFEDRILQNGLSACRPNRVPSCL